MCDRDRQNSQNGFANRNDSMFGIFVAPNAIHIY